MLAEIYNAETDEVIATVRGSREAIERKLGDYDQDEPLAWREVHGVPVGNGWEVEDLE